MNIKNEHQMLRSDGHEVNGTVKIQWLIENESKKLPLSPSLGFKIAKFSFCEMDCF